MEKVIGVSVKLDESTLAELRRLAAKRQLKTGNIWTTVDLVREGIALIIRQEQARKE